MSLSYNCFFTTKFIIKPTQACTVFPYLLFIFTNVKIATTNDSLNGEEAIQVDKPVIQQRKRSEKVNKLPRLLVEAQIDYKCNVH